MNEVFRLPAFAWCFLFGFTKQLNPNDKDCSRGDLMVCCTCKHMNPHKKDMCEMLNLLFSPLAIFRLFYMDISFWDPYLLAIGSSIWTPNTPSTHLSVHTQCRSSCFPPSLVPSSSHLGFVSASGTGSLNFDSVWAVVSSAGFTREIWC